jgi:hypothetical protein
LLELLVCEHVDERGVDGVEELGGVRGDLVEALVGERGQGAAPVVGRILAGEQAAALQPVDDAGDAAAASATTATTATPTLRPSPGLPPPTRSSPRSGSSRPTSRNWSTTTTSKDTSITRH